MTSKVVGGVWCAESRERGLAFSLRGAMQAQCSHHHSLTTHPRPPRHATPHHTHYWATGTAIPTSHTSSITMDQGLHLRGNKATTATARESAGGNSARIATQMLNPCHGRRSCAGAGTRHQVRLPSSVDSAAAQCEYSVPPSSTQARSRLRLGNHHCTTSPPPGSGALLGLDQACKLGPVLFRLEQG